MMYIQKQTIIYNAMKHTFKYILSAIVMLVPVLAFAQGGEELPDPPIYADYKVGGGVATKKTVGDPDANGVYKITLETFATGMTSIINRAIPSDIVLVLDYSSSMLMTGSAQPNRTDDMRTRLYDLKNAVGEFVTMMKDNNSTMGLQPGQMGNRIAFVLFAGQVYDPEASLNSNNGIFRAAHVKEFIEVDDLAVDNTIMEHHPVWTRNTTQYNYASTSVTYTPDGTDILSPASQHPNNHNNGYNGISNQIDIGDVNKGTNSGAAMTVAKDLVNNNLSKYSLDERTTVVVFFTDGEPSSGSGFSATVADACINAAHDIKEKDVLVYTIGLVEGSDDTNQVKTYLEYTSSDYSKILPEGEPYNPTDMPQYVDAGGNYIVNDSRYLDRNATYGPYSFKVSQEYTLSDIFKTIGEASAGSEASIPGETQVVDCVSNSFEVPDAFEAENVVVYTKTINKAGTEFGNAETLVVDVIEEDDLGDNPPMTVNYTPQEGHIGVALVDGKLTVVGYDYSKADDEGVTPYNGHWVGWRAEDDCAGQELVIEFNVQAKEAATGGDGTNTNTTQSGVFVPVFDDDNNIIDYVNVNSYDVPHKDLPINLVIEKSGLRAGESATVQIYRCAQKVVNGKVQYNPNTGKPLPEKEIPAPGVDPGDLGWQNFSKVILTNTTGVNGATVSKSLLSLHAEYVYLLVEDNWGWAYELDTQVLNTSDVELNPFTFVNTERTDAPKHAEAVSINHFGTVYSDDERVKTYKSSKVESF